MRPLPTAASSVSASPVPTTRRHVLAAGAASLFAPPWRGPNPASRINRSR